MTFLTPVPESIALNSSFSKHTAGLQVAWDSTSLGALKECPRKYYYSIVQGYEPKRLSIHLIFGLHYHAALERYDHAKSAGSSHEDAMDAAVQYALEITWNKELGRPWASDDSNKNRFTLVRTVVWYLLQFENDALETVQLSNGKPAVELSFRTEIGYESPLDGPFMYCGHMDRVAMFNSEPYIVDRKTSKNTLSTSFFAKYSPDNQFSGYMLCGNIVYNIPLRGLIVDAAQVAVTFSRFERGIVTRTEAQLGEWHKDLGFWLEAAKRYAEAEYWPQNDKSCDMYGGCQFRGICSKSPQVREQWMNKEFTTRTWDPLLVRGDI